MSVYLPWRTPMGAAQLSECGVIGPRPTEVAAVLLNPFGDDAGADFDVRPMIDRAQARSPGGATPPPTAIDRHFLGLYIQS